MSLDLPDIFPLEEIIVKDEQHTYKVFQGDNGLLPKTEYTIDKAPIKEIDSVTGILNGSSGHEFVEGVDYELSADAEDILWLNGDRPDAGTIFYVTYRSKSIMGRYVESGEEELETVEDRLIDAIQGKFVREAEGRELDALGSLFGQTIGKRRNRNDTQYRIYLQSVVQSFVSRGTKTGIKLAVSAATEVPVSEITIREDFQKNEYEIVVIPNTPVRVSVIEKIADIADPSGVKLLRSRFPVFEDIGVDDEGGLTDNNTITSDKSVSVDSVQSNRLAQFEDSVFDDTAILSPKDAVTSDTAFSDDTATIPPKDAVTSDDLTAGDALASQTNTVAWDTGSWESMDWATDA